MSEAEAIKRGLLKPEDATDKPKEEVRYIRVPVPQPGRVEYVKVKSRVVPWVYILTSMLAFIIGVYVGMNYR